jgi:hypothetical protein
MIGRTQVLRIVAVLSVAVATGHAVETLRTGPAHAARDAGVASGGGLPDLAGITSVAAASDPAAPDGCAPHLALAAAPGATIDLVLTAPCDMGERVVLRHSGLSFAERVGADGQLRLRLPALVPEALVAAYFEGSQVALQSVSVPEAAQVIRFVFQAAHPLRFDLRASEAGQVFAGSSARTGQDAARGVVTLGRPSVSQPIVAQVYSFPAADLGAADVTVELRITPETCSRSFQAETLLSSGGKVDPKTVPVAMPLCGTGGDILVLKNLLPAPKLAASE